MSRSRIAVNGRYLRQHLTGVQRFSTEVAKRLSEADVIAPSRGLGRGMLGHLWEQFVLPSYVGGRPLLSLGNIGPIRARRHAVVVHDMAVFDHPEWFSWQYAKVYRMLYPRLMRNAACILTVSAFSESRILKWFPQACGKTVIVGIGVRQWCGSREAENTPTPYFLYVGSVEPRKNLDRLIEAWRRSELWRNGYSLRIVGSVNTTVFAHSSAGSFQGVSYMGRRSDDELALLYKNATAFVYPSLYEGFGLPPVEAAICGCTCLLVSDLPALREHLGNRANFFEPDNPDSIARAMKRASSDEVIRWQWTAEDAVRYSWNRVAGKIQEAINAL